MVTLKRIRGVLYGHLFFLLILLPGCAHRQAFQSVPVTVNYTLPSASTEISEPELLGIPVPFYAACHALDTSFLYAQNGLSAWSYETDLPVQDIITFYTQNMDQLGWRCDWSIVTDEESLLFFTTPIRECIVSIHSHHAKKQFVLFVKEKVYATSLEKVEHFL